MNTAEGDERRDGLRTGPTKASFQPGNPQAKVGGEQHAFPLRIGGTAEGHGFRETQLPRGSTNAQTVDEDGFGECQVFQVTQPGFTGSSHARFSTSSKRGQKLPVPKARKRQETPQLHRRGWLAADWCCEGFFERPPTETHASAESAGLDSVQVRPDRQRHNATIGMLKPDRTATVVVLLRSGSPSHVARRVVTVVVDAVDCVRWGRRRANIGEKLVITTVATPLIAYSDTASTVVGIVSMCWIVAPLNHLAEGASFFTFTAIAAQIGNGTGHDKTFLEVTGREPAR